MGEEKGERGKEVDCARSSALWGHESGFFDRCLDNS